MMTIQSQSPEDIQAFYVRKLYALLQASTKENSDEGIFPQLYEAIPELRQADTWWQQHGQQIEDVSSASDRVNLHPASELSQTDDVDVRHPISGQSQRLDRIERKPIDERSQQILEAKRHVEAETDSAAALKQLYWWCWRFYPELREDRKTALLNPAHRILPDCPLPSYKSTVSALSGAMFPSGWQQEDESQQPYLLLFTFSPVQEFIKASRKFADFWSGSYMLHYLSARLCWRIAQDYGPDAVITPSLWGQEIIDALLVKDYPAFKDFFQDTNKSSEYTDPVSLFNRRESASLSTAGFPNTITALVPGREHAIALGQALQTELQKVWSGIAEKVREHIKGRVLEHLSGDGVDETWEQLKGLFSEQEQPIYRRELEKLQQHGCWEWNKLWKAQIENTWQPYFVAVPLGHPDTSFAAASTDESWRDQQNAIALPREPLPTDAEQQAYQHLNVGTWWGSLQARLGQSMQAIKNTRRWQIPIAPGERSSLSGQFSALHPLLHYKGRLKHGRGMAAGSMRMFWKLMSLAYPGLFDGSERLNALELTKRMAWIYGGVAEELGIPIKDKIIKRINKYRPSDSKARWGKAEQLSYGQFSRFPNSSSIASARFIHDHPEVVRKYLAFLEESITSNSLSPRQPFIRTTQKQPSQLPKTDKRVNPQKRRRHYLNGVMFSGKWLAEDLGLAREDAISLKGVVNQAHQAAGFGDSSPSDWWVLLLADGDGMGQYVNGRKLHPYKEYLIEGLVNCQGIDEHAWNEFRNNTQKRMGPATHVGLNRALLDFSNRLVPHLTEHRFCGKVIYSGGDDVLVALPLADLPGYARSLRAAWCGDQDPENQFDHREGCGYWHPPDPLPDNMRHLQKRPLFTMGAGATMSMGIIIAHKSVPLPTVLENLWEAESDQAKKLLGGQPADVEEDKIPAKDGLCFRVIYGSGNTLEALMKGHLLDHWWEMIRSFREYDLSPVFNRLAEELPKHAAVTECDHLCCQAAKAILLRREDQLSEDVQRAILNWLSKWESWAWAAQQTDENAIGTTLDDLAALLRFTAFWVTRRRQELSWVNDLGQAGNSQTEEPEVSHV